MKLLKEIAQKLVKDHEEDCFVHFYTSNEGYIALDPPKKASEMTCVHCGETKGYTWNVSKENKAWICGRVCSPSELPIDVKGRVIQPSIKRAMEWPLFCEINGIGDIHHDVRFEKVEQSKGMLACLSKFASNPFGSMVMQGSPGSGKTYASLAVSELFTRKNPSAIFLTQKQLFDKWLDKFNSRIQDSLNSLEIVMLLVIDDFGTGELSSGFMAYFLDLINTRMQWTQRGTIITTNLSDLKLSGFCGDALSDRLNTGQKLVFSDKSRRKLK